MRKSTISAVAAVILSTAALTACTQGAAFPNVIQVQNAESQQNIVTVQASEKIQVVPDIAEIIFAVSTQAADAKECQTKNSEDLDKVIKLFEAQGIESKSIQTSNYGLNPIYDWNNGQTLTGYEMKTTITVSDVLIDQVGVLLTASIDAGANNIESVTYLSSNYTASYEEALKKAIDTARNKAQAIASADSRNIDAMLRVEEQADNQEVRYTGYRNSGAGAASKEEAAVSMDVAPGQLDIEARVTVDFLMK